MAAHATLSPSPNAVSETRTLRPGDATVASLEAGALSASADRLAAQAAATGPQRVLYVVSQFPSLSETFIAREIQALVDLGVDVRILSLKFHREKLTQPQAAALAHRVMYPAGRARTTFAALLAFLRRPVVTASFVLTMLLELWRRPVALGKSLVAVFRALGRLDEIRGFAPQLIHAPWATYPATVAWLLSRQLDLPFSFTSRAHDIFIEDHMMARKLESAALAVTITQFNQRFMARWMRAPGSVPVHVIHSALNLPDLPFVRTGRQPLKLLSVGRLVPMKGFDILITALAQLRERGIEVSCTIIGEGPERGRLEHLRSTLGLESVVALPGAMPQGDVVRHMTDATLMVLPCVVAKNGQSDGIPNVLMESMATGLPVVSTRISGIPELIEDGVSGSLVEAGDAAGLAEAIETLLHDPDRRESYAQAGRRKVEREFDVRIEARRLFDLFGNVTARHMRDAALATQGRQRVLVVIDSMEVGGSQRQIQHLLAGLDRQRWEPELLFFRTDSFLVDAIRHDGIPVHFIEKRARVDLRFLRDYARLLRDRNYALIHAYSLTAELWTLPARLLSRRRPALIASERSAQRDDRPTWYWWLKRFVLARSAAVIANSRAGAQATARRTRTPGALFTTIANDVGLPDPIDADTRARIRKDLDVPQGRLFGLFVGRLVPVKNLACLVRALALLEPAQRPWIALVGDGPLRASLAELAHELGVSADIHFLGERRDATRLMQAADFLVLPSLFEGTSNALLEAMAGGCPVVASAVGGSAELIDHGYTGLLFPSDDAQAFAAAIKRLFDTEFRTALAQAARRHVEQNHSQAALAAATALVYERCLRAVPMHPPHAASASVAASTPK
ncbi:glycosyltransferase [Lysobacter terrae]